MTPLEAAHAFATAINHQNPEEIARQMTEDHVFIDSLGSRVAGREAMHAGWKMYFGWFPDYTVTIEESFSSGDVVVLTGTAQGTYRGSTDAWRIPAAWRAVVRGDQIAEWRVWADNDPVRKILAKHQ